MGIVSSFKKNGLEYFTLARAKLFVRYLFRKVFGVRMPMSKVHVYAEIVTYRALTCSECVALGECTHCGCDMKGLITDLKSECSDGKWAAVDELNMEEDWNRQKQEKKTYVSVGFYLCISVNVYSANYCVRY